jgi:Flp pilus assembly protein TadD
MMKNNIKYCNNIKLAKLLTCLFVGVSLVSSCGTSKDAKANMVDGKIAFKPESLNAMAENFIKAGDYNSALRFYQRAASENPTNLEARMGLAKTYQALGAANQALFYYKQVLKINPKHDEAMLGLSQILIAKNDPKEALAYLSKLEGSATNNYKLYNSRGLAYDLNGEHEKAQISYGKGLDISAENISLLNNLALSYGIAGQYAPSIQIFSKAINLDYTKETARHNLVMIYALSGEIDAARKMAVSLMDENEIEAKFKHYEWLKTLTSAERAQAIFLNVKKFRNEKPVEVGKILNATESNIKITPMTNELTPRQLRLKEILSSEKSLTDKPEGMIDVQKKDLTSLKGLYIQLVSYKKKANTDGHWDKINKKDKVKELLSSYQPIIKRASVKGSDYYRLYIGDFKTSAEANSLCSKLDELSVACYVLRIK